MIQLIIEINQIGFYIDLKKLPGEITENEDDLIRAIKNLDYDKINDRYEEFNKKYNYLDDGHAADRVVEECIK